MKRSSQHGVALVLTLILLSIITFTTVTFLAVSRRERGAVSTTTEQNVAKLAADTAIEEAKARALARMLTLTNRYVLGFAVSTNYINWIGFVPGVSHPTNVNYDRRATDGQPLDASQLAQNIANLFYDPRPPVFVRTNRNPALPLDFRFYLDLNRNGRYDTNGLWPVIGPNGGFLHPDGTESGNPVGAISNFFVGDPEWIGVLADPTKPHSPTNRFVARYAYVVVPLGQAMDINFVHNQALQKNNLGQLNPNDDGYFRNQGVGGWEINLAAFLADLNTNYSPVLGGRYWEYAYNRPQGTPVGAPNTGSAFRDAFNVIYYRYNGWYGNLLTPFELFGQAGRNAFINDYIDRYSDGPLMLGIFSTASDATSVDYPWLGSDNTNAAANFFSTTQDLFDTNKVGPHLPFCLLDTGRRTSSYDRYTFYRLMAQLGTESAPADEDKININYLNVGGVKATNFVSWADPDIRYGNPQRGIPAFGLTGPAVFFTATANKLLQQFNGYVGVVQVDLPGLPRGTLFQTNTLSVTNIPVWPINFYTPSVHRLLQLAANIYDATTNSPLPSVFRPIFRRVDTNVFIAGYVEEQNARLVTTAPLMLNLADPANLAQVRLAQQPINPDDNAEPMVWGIPVVIGAKKGLPNFNEFAFQSVVQITRKLQLRRPSKDARIAEWLTNQMFVLGISNVLGVEAWNSYFTPYPRKPVDIYVTNLLSITLTNEKGGKWSLPQSGQQFVVVGTHLSLGTNWAGFNTIDGGPSFIIPLLTNVVFLPDSIFRFNGNRFEPNLAAPYTDQVHPLPQFGLVISNRLWFAIVDRSVTPNRIIDYVNLDGLNDFRDLNAETQTRGVGFQGLWNTNVVNGVPEGVIYQIGISLGEYQSDKTDWRNYGINQADGQFKFKEIANFRAFFSPSYRATYEGFTAYNTNLIQDVPFTPTRKIAKRLTWQASDPLVHYTAWDLLDLAQTNVYTEIKPPGGPALTPYDMGLGRLNERYRPWGRFEPTVDSDTFNFALKDPLVRRSDDWQFPTNKFPNIGWLGRVHRGTPWQTVFLKATNIIAYRDPAHVNAGFWRWVKWTGNALGATNIVGMDPKVFADAMLSAPIADWRILDIFTTAPNENATRGRLSVNQSGLAAWSAVLSGVIALTNDPVTGALTPVPIEPAGVYNPNQTPLPPLVQIVNGINRTRADTNLFPDRVFTAVGEVLATPELTERSPFLNTTHLFTKTAGGISDAVMERIPQQIMSLLCIDDRFVVYAYGQALKPAENSILLSGPFRGLCTNYQITAEVAARAVVRIEGSPEQRTAEPDSVFYRPDPRRRYPLRLVTESFNYLPVD